MANIVKEFMIDCTKPNRFRTTIAKQGDMNSRFIKATIASDGVPITVENGATVVINAKRSDNAVRTFSGSVNEDGTVLVPIANWMLEKDGHLDCEIIIVLAASQEKLSTTRFTIEVEPRISDGSEIEDDDDYDFLLELIEDVETALENANTAVTEAQTATSGANTAAASARSAASAATSGATAATNAAQSASNAASSASRAAADANEISTLLNQRVESDYYRGEKGDKGDKGDKGEPGKGTETIVVTTNEELTAALEKITSEFKAGSVYSVIGTGTLLGIESPFSEADMKGLTAERIIIDRGTGEYKDALVVTNYVNTTMLHLNQERRITTLKSDVASINSRIAMPKRYADLENTAYDAKTGARFDASSNNTHVIATLILPSSESAVTLNIGTALLTLPSVKENSSLTFEAEKITNEIWKAEYTLVDDTGNLVVSDTVYKKSGMSKASRIALTGYAAEKTFTITYLAGGQI